MLHAMTTEMKSKTQSSGARSTVADKPGRDREFAFADRPWSTAFNALNGQTSIQRRSQALTTLQRAIGNQAILRMLASERGHDGALQRKCACGGQAQGGECASCATKREASLKRLSTDRETAGAVPPIVNEVLRSPGQPLDAATRSFMEPRFGYDFGEVRVHDDAKAAASAEAVGALAYTVGRDVVFGSGQSKYGAPAGRRLLAHELAHVVQNGGKATNQPRSVGDPSDASERDAERIAVSVINPAVTGQTLEVGSLEAPSVNAFPVLHRQADIDSSGLSGFSPCDLLPLGQCTPCIPWPSSSTGFRKWCHVKTCLVDPRCSPINKDETCWACDCIPLQSTAAGPEDASLTCGPAASGEY